MTVAPIIAGTGHRGSVALSAALTDGNFGTGTAVSLRVTRINADRYITPLVPMPDAPGIIGACLRTPTNEIAQADMMDAQGRILDQIGGHS